MSEPRPDTPEKRVGWAELFFDLVFVVAVTRVSGLIEVDHHASGVLRALIVFVPVYWLWVGTAVLTNLGDSGRAVLRLRIFAVALAAVFMALSMADAYGEHGHVFAIAYWAGRAVLVGLGPWRTIARRMRSPYGVSVIITGPLLFVGSFFDPTPRMIIWAVAAAIDLSAPTLLRRTLRHMHYDPGHLAERFGLFVLIALGESVVAVASATEDLSVLTAATVALAFVIAVGLWWTYFQFAADAVRHALSTAAVQLDIVRIVLSYGHLLFIAAIIAVAVGLHDAIGHPDHHLSWSLTLLLYGGTAVYLATFGLTRWAMFRLVSWTRLIAAACVVVLIPAAPFVPVVVALLGLGVVLVVLNTVEYSRVERIGWRSLLARRGN